MEQLQESIKSAIRENKEVLLSNEINESLDADVKSIYQDRLITGFTELLGSNDKHSGFIEKEKVFCSYDMTNALNFNIVVKDLTNAMKVGKTVKEYKFTITDSKYAKDVFPSEIDKMGVIKWIESHKDTFDIDVLEEKGYEVFSPFAIANIKPLKKLNTRKIKRADVIKILANNQFTEIHNTSRPRGGAPKELTVNRIELISNIYLWYGVSYLIESNASNETSGTINLYFGGTVDYKIDYDLTKK